MKRTRQKGKSKVQSQTGAGMKGIGEGPAETWQQATIYQTFKLGGLLVLIGGIVLITYWPALSAKALSFDDDQYLVKNELVQNPSGTSVGRFLSEILEPSTVKGYYQPLTMISLMLDYALGGQPENLTPFHRTSLALHILNTMLVIILVYLLFGSVPVAGAIGLLFGVHPINVESIPWVAERKTLLAAFFALLCLIFYVCYAGKRRLKLYGISVAMYVLALMAKPTSVPLPLLMVLLDYWPLRRLGKKTVLEKMPFFAIGAVSVVVTFISQRATFGVRMPGEYGLGRVPLIICHNIILYLYNIFWPTNLSLFYPFPRPMGLSHPMVLAGVVGTCVLIIVLLVSLRWGRAVLAGWLFFFVAIFPTMGVVGFHDMIAADRHAYLPFVGILLPLAYLLCRFCNAGTSASGRTVRSVVILVVVTSISVLEGVATRRYLVYWQDTESHHRRMLALAPREAIPHNSLAVALAQQGKLDEAVMHYREALRLKSGVASVVHYNLANALRQLGKDNEAIMHYGQAIGIKPEYAEAHNNLGLALAELGRFEEALACYSKAIRLKVNYAEAYYNRAIASAGLGKLDEAVADFGHALLLKPNYPEAHNNLGVVLASQGKVDKAIQEFQRAVRLKPLDSDMHCNLAILLERRGRMDEAVREYRTVLRIKPDHSKARKKLEAALAKLRD